MRLKDFMIPLASLVYLSEEATVDEVSQYILNAHVGSVVIVKKNSGTKPTAIGMVTKTDLLRAYSSGRTEVGKAKIVDFVQKSLVMVNQEESRDKVAEYMVKHGFHHVLVGNDAKEIVGIVSSMDLAREFVEDSKSLLRKLFGIPKQRQTVENFVEKTLDILDGLVPHQEIAIWAIGY
jgi:CBS domain-containing protein